MTQQISYKLGKRSRIKSQKLIQEIFKDGKSVTIFPLRGVYLPENKTNTLQVAVSVSKARHKKATDRNRVKRLMRESWRLQKHVLENALLQNEKRLSVFITFLDKEMPEYDAVFKATGKLIDKLMKLALIDSQNSNTI